MKSLINAKGTLEGEWSGYRKESTSANADTILGLPATARVVVKKILLNFLGKKPTKKKELLTEKFLGEKRTLTLPKPLGCCA